MSFEDIPQVPDKNYPGKSYSDSSYDNDVFSLSNVTGLSTLVAPTPEPSTFVLLGTGVFAAVGAARPAFPLSQRFSETGHRCRAWLKPKSLVVVFLLFSLT